MTAIRHLLWVLFAVLSILIGIYPLIYLFVEGNFGFLSTKPLAVLESMTWNIGFYTHIFFGGTSLLVGWTQFSSKLRKKSIQLHRNFGKVYLICAIPSGLSGLFLANYANGGWVSSAGFGSLALVWLTATLIAYSAIRAKNIKRHQTWMILSFAACFAAVTLRLWLPVLTAMTSDAITAYRMVAWLCWVPNLLVALMIIRYSRK
jgi:uncharacterized membrane protein